MKRIQIFVYEFPKIVFGHLLHFHLNYPSWLTDDGKQAFLSMTLDMTVLNANISQLIDIFLQSTF